jgi:hypothetical protein
MANRRTPPFDWEKLDAILRYKATIVDCSEMLDVSHDTVERNIKKKYDMTFTEYRDKKLTHTRLSLIQKALEQAKTGNTTMLIFCLKNLCGWSDKMEHGFEKDKQTIVLKYNLDEKKEE